MATLKKCESPKRKTKVLHPGHIFFKTSCPSCECTFAYHVDEIFMSEHNSPVYVQCPICRMPSFHHYLNAIVDRAMIDELKKEFNPVTDESINIAKESVAANKNVYMPHCFDCEHYREDWEKLEFSDLPAQCRTCLGYSNYKKKEAKDVPTT